MTTLKKDIETLANNIADMNQTLATMYKHLQGYAVEQARKANVDVTFCSTKWLEGAIQDIQKFEARRDVQEAILKALRHAQDDFET